ncbi:MAG TPA: hypothetical protein VIM56_06125 [Rhizomicrobium sp.]
MRNFRLFITVLASAIAATTPAYADPVSGLIVAALSTIGVSTTIAAVNTFLISSALALGATYVQKAVTGKPKQGVGGSSGKIQTGGVLARSFIVGRGITGGKAVYFNTWGKVDKTPNAYFTMVIALQDLPMTGLVEFWMADTKCTYDTSGVAEDWGYPVPEFHINGKDYLWVKVYDGTQTVADPWLVSQFGADPSRPYGANRVGYGVPYVVVTARDDPTIYSGFPTYKWVVDGIKVYDPRKDSTVGGSGTHRFGLYGTYEHSLNPKTIEYNLFRGLNWNGTWFYGLQNLNASRLPLSAWFAAMNECDREIALAGGGTVAQFQCGGEITVDTPTADLVDELNKSCNGRTAEIGGIYKPWVGAAGSAVLTFTDDDVITTEKQSDTPFPSLDQTINGMTGSYPEPAAAYAAKDAPPLYNPDLEAADNNRRLTADVSYNMVPFGEQVQRLMKSGSADARKFRNNAVVLGPSAFGIEPVVDFARWTSPRRGYENKLMSIEGVTIAANLGIGLVVKEVDPSDYDWDPDEDYSTPNHGSLIRVRPPAQTLAGFSVEGVAIPGDGGRQKPAIRLHWDPDQDDIDGVQYIVSLASSGAVVLAGQTDHWQDGEGDITAGLSSATNYNVEARYRSKSDRQQDWTPPLPVTTPDIRIDAEDIYDEAIGFQQFRQEVRDMQNFIGSQARALMDELQLAIHGSMEGMLGGMSDVQTLREELHSKAQDLTADYTRAIEVATGPLGAAVVVLEELSAAYGGEALSDIVLGLDSRITDNAGDIAASNDLIDSLTSLVGNFSASGLFRVSTNASINGAAATIAIAAAASSGGSASTAAMYVNAKTDGTSEIIFSASRILMTDGTNFDNPFLYSAGSLYVKSAVIPNLDASIINTGILNVNRINGLSADQFIANGMTKSALTQPSSPSATSGTSSAKFLQASNYTPKGTGFISITASVAWQITPVNSHKIDHQLYCRARDVASGTYRSINGGTPIQIVQSNGTADIFGSWSWRFVDTVPSAASTAYEIWYSAFDESTVAFVAGCVIQGGGGTNMLIEEFKA